GAAGFTFSLAPGVLTVLLVLGALPALLGPVLQVAFPIDSIDYRQAFTDLMWYGGAVAAPVGYVVLRGISGSKPSPERTCLLASLFLFGLGGLIGYLITGVNVTIPAHYHGSIVAITLAYMGLTYHLLPRLGSRPISPVWASRQAVLLMIGQSMHSIGLAWSGGHNVQRKVAGAEQVLQTPWEKIPMYFMSVGGLLAVVGGVLFLVLTLRAIWPLLRDSGEGA
ncbi:MAG: cbb3-type cytochrome c oxidase subunit I, partial [Magnetococcales bacterium]|nr:cbb3-type cytochrome c oxidase subunit I [Magnetococcales bacterium]